MTTEYLDSIECSDQPLDIAFHPKVENILLAGLVDGTVEVHDIRAQDKSDDDGDDDDDDGPDSILSSTAIHKQLLPEKKNANKLKPASCRTVSFSTDGTRYYTGGSAGDMCSVDAEYVQTFSTQSKINKNLLWKIDTATEGKFNPLVALHPFESSQLLATGDDTGGIRVWDERLCGNVSSTTSSTSTGATKRPNGCVLSWKENDDYISDFETSSDGNTLLATSADGRLAVFDLRMCREAVNSNGQEQSKQKQGFRLSDDQEDELLSLKVLKHGKKVVCGTQEGVLTVFSWGTWGDCSDRFPGHPSSIDALLKVDEDTLLTGSSDGYIRVVQIHPDKLIGVIGDDHDGFPIEQLGFNADRTVIGSVSHDNMVRLWDAKVLQDGYDENGVGDGKLQQDAAGNRLSSQKQTSQMMSSYAQARDSDDEWDDMDEDGDDDDDGKNDGNDGDDDDDDDDDSDDSDDSDAMVETINDKRKNRLKSENEKFFDDL